ncbi:MAG: hypothetical protein FJ147_07110 [Deltaproteobacteria bacterium]|nr:hypothetical protein [Deltaproteobacteria bacterium]
MLSDLQIERYSRQIILPHVGGKGQERLLRARVLVSGHGSWHAQALLYLAAAGLGHIGICGNEDHPMMTALLPEQQHSALVALQRLNPDCEIVTHSPQLLCDVAKAAQLVQQYDLVIAEPHVSLHTACYTTQRPFICGQVAHASAWFAVYRGYEDGLPCLACEPLPARAPDRAPPVDWPVGPFLGTILATEGIKYILGLSQQGSPQLRQYTFPQLSFSARRLTKNDDCSVCRRSQ